MKILLIDDCADQMKHVFNQFETYFAENEEEALKIIKDQKNDIILMDGNLGFDFEKDEMISGIDLVARLRNSGIKIKIIMFSSDKDLNEKGIIAGADGSWNKKNIVEPGWEKSLLQFLK